MLWSYQAKVKLAKAEKALSKVQEALVPIPTDLDTFTNEERNLDRSMGLKMRAYLSRDMLSYQFSPSSFPPSVPVLPSSILGSSTSAFPSSSCCVREEEYRRHEILLGNSYIWNNLVVYTMNFTTLASHYTIDSAASHNIFYSM